jgi:hypothetical protein
MDGVADTTKAVATDALDAAKDLAEIFFMWILPIILVIVGIFTANQIGLSGALGTAFSDLTSVSQSGVVIIADLVAAGIWGGVAAAFFGFSSREKITRADGFNVAWILRPIGGLFLGWALGELLNALAGKVGNGSIGALTTKLEAGVTKLSTGG